MLSVAVCLVLGLVLVVSAVLKLADRQGTEAALTTYGIRTGASFVWGALIVVEAGLGVAVAAGVDAAAYAAAVLMAGFAAAQGAALASGRGGRPCACFGARGTGIQRRAQPHAAARGGTGHRAAAAAHASRAPRAGSRSASAPR